jgi:hypothetical protein
MATIAGGFAAENGNIRKLLVALAKTPDFRFLALESTTP